MLSSSDHFAWKYWEFQNFLEHTAHKAGVLPKREGTVSWPKIQQRHLLACYWELASQKLIFSVEIVLLTKENGFDHFGNFYSTYFCNFLDKSQAICLENCKNMSCKNSQNVLNQFHCQTTKFLLENGFCSALSPSNPTKKPLHSNVWRLTVTKNAKLYKQFTKKF